MLPAKIQPSAKTFYEKPAVENALTAVAAVMDNLSIGKIIDFITGFFDPQTPVEIIIIKIKIFIKQADPIDCFTARHQAGANYKINCGWLC